jgi:hypothetical protein
MSRLINLLIFVILLFAFSTRANARLGESYDELVKRFGAELEPQPEIPYSTASLIWSEVASTLTGDKQFPKEREYQKKANSIDISKLSFHRFRAGDIFVSVVLMDGRACYESYNRSNPFKPEEENALRTANAGDYVWVDEFKGVNPDLENIRFVIRETNPIRYMVNKGSALAFYVADLRVFAVESIKRIIDESEKRRKANLNTF